MRAICAAIATLLLVGCASYAGPVVTNISSDGRGALVVEKCLLRLDRNINTVDTRECSSSTILLSRESSHEEDD